MTSIDSVTFVGFNDFSEFFFFNSSKHEIINKPTRFYITESEIGESVATPGDDNFD